MTVRLPRRQDVVQRGLDLIALAAALVEGHVGGDAVDPARQRRPPLEAYALAHHLQEDVLDDLLGVGGVARDAVGQAVHAARIPAHQGFERTGVAASGVLQQMLVALRHHPHSNTPSSSASRTSEARSAPASTSSAAPTAADSGPRAARARRKAKAAGASARNTTSSP